MNEGRTVLLRLVLLLAFSTSAPIAAQVPDLVYLRFNEGSGQATADAAVPGLGGSAPMLSDPASWNTTDPYLGAACLSPATPGTSVAHLGANYATAGGDYSFEFAIRPRSAPSINFPRYFLGGPGAGDYRIGLLEVFPGESQLYFEAGAGRLIVTPTLPHDRWTFVSLVFADSENQIRVYYDAKLVKRFDVWQPLALPSSGPLAIGRSDYLPQAPQPADLDEFRLWGSARPAKFIEMNCGFEIESFDLGIGDLLAPAPLANPAQFYGNAETVKVEIINGGSAAYPAGSLPLLDLYVDGQLVASEGHYLATGLQPGAAETHVFLATADLSWPGAHRIEVVVTDPGDLQHGNDARSFVRHGGGPGTIAELPFLEYFGAPFLPGTAPSDGWEDAYGGGGSWRIENSSSTWDGGPIVGNHTSSHYLAATPPTLTTSALASELLSPVIDLGAAIAPRCQFYLHHDLPHPSNTANGGLPWLPSQLAIDVLEYGPGAATALHLDQVPAASLAAPTSGWTRRIVDLTPFAGKVIRLRFRASLNQTIIALDEFGIDDAGLITAGQAARPGLALLRLTDVLGHESETRGYELAASGRPGPYAIAHGQVNASVVVGIEAAPLQPIMFIRGRPAIASASFPGIGQLDIGGDLDPLTGLPEHLVVVANGFNPVGIADFYCLTDAAGQCNLTTLFPTAWPGWSWGLQALVGSPQAPFILLSNAIHGSQDFLGY